MSIQYILTAYHSAPDRAGNVYWAFSYRDCATGHCVNGRISGGESNISGIRQELNGGRWPMPETYHWSSGELPIRQFNAMIRSWPYAGCAPADLAAFIVTQLAAQSDAQRQDADVQGRC